MVAQTTDGLFFLKSPRIFQLKYLHRGQAHTSINRFKDCALRSLNVEYTPQGTYATFPDGVMHGYRVTMQFTELDPVLSRDYDDLDRPTGPVPVDPVFSTTKQIGF